MEKNADYQALLTLSEEACKTASDAATLSRKALEKSDGHDLSLKTSAEKMEEASRAIKDLTGRLDNLDRKIIYPDFDPMRLKYDRTQRGFERLMRSKPSSETGVVGMNALVEELQIASTQASLVKLFYEGAHGKKYEWSDIKQMEVSQRSEEQPTHRFERLCNLFGDMLGIKEKRSLDTQTAGEGLEWVPTMWGTQLMAKLIVALRAAGLLETIQMPSADWRWPYKTSYPSAQRVTETTTMTANPWATSGVTEGYTAGKPSANRLFSAHKIRIAQFESFEFTVDAIVAAVNDLMDSLVTGLAIAKETGMFNGDRSDVHLDADTLGIGSAGTAPETVVDGFRNFYLAQGAGSIKEVTATPTTIDLLNATRLISKEYSVDHANQYWFASVLGCIHLYANRDCRTLDKIGPNAIITAGMIGQILNRSIIAAGTMRDDINASGVNEAGGNNAFTAIILAHISRWKWGSRPSSPMDAERLPLTDQRLFVVHDRYDLQFVGSDTDRTVIGIHGIPQEITQDAA